jgi:hypothetical protein
VDLKDILAKANVPAKGNKKADLISVILSNQSTLDVYNGIHGEQSPLGSQKAAIDIPVRVGGRDPPTQMTNITRRLHPNRTRIHHLCLTGAVPDVCTE